LTVEHIQYRVVAGITLLVSVQRQSVSYSLLLHSVFVLCVQVKAEWFVRVFPRSQGQIPPLNTLFCGCVFCDFDFVSYYVPRMS